MNLREAKHWAYGAGSFLSNAIGQRPFLMTSTPPETIFWTIAPVILSLRRAENSRYASATSPASAKSSFTPPTSVRCRIAGPTAFMPVRVWVEMDPNGNEIALEIESDNGLQTILELPLGVPRR